MSCWMCRTWSLACVLSEACCYCDMSSAVHLLHAKIIHSVVGKDRMPAPPSALRNPAFALLNEVVDRASLTERELMLP